MVLLQYKINLHPFGNFITTFSQMTIILTGSWLLFHLRSLRNIKSTTPIGINKKLIFILNTFWAWKPISVSVRFGSATTIIIEKETRIRKPDGKNSMGIWENDFGNTETRKTRENERKRKGKDTITKRSKPIQVVQLSASTETLQPLQYIVLCCKSKQEGSERS